MLVRSLCKHIQPGPLKFREEGEEFEHPGPSYEHIEPVEPKKRGKAGKQDDEA